ncbi:ribokinase [Clostridia bacterium]|nr:ribokinase [Clostridia bacterium]
MSKPRILTVGSSNMDLVLQMDRIPEAGETIIGEKYSHIPGGKGANAAAALARLGVDSVLCSRIGADDVGEKLTQTYSTVGIDTRYIITDRTEPTGMAAILLDRKGVNRITVYPGANLALTPEDVENAFLSYPDAVYLSFETNPETVIAATNFAGRQNVPVFIDAGPIRENFPFDRLGKIEIISPNESECVYLTGINPAGADHCLRACMKLHEIFDTKHSVLKLSNRGCFWYDGRHCEFLLAHNVTAVDTTAAGDAFTAALTYQYLKSGGDIAQSVKFANAAGALAVTKSGATPSMPTINEVNAFLADRGVKL